MLRPCRFKLSGMSLLLFLKKKRKKKDHLPLVLPGNRWSLGCALCFIRTPYVSSVITFRSLFGAQWQRDWVGHSLTTVSVSHRRRERICPEHSEARICVPLCGRAQFSKLWLRCVPEIFSRIYNNIFLIWLFQFCQLTCVYHYIVCCLLSCVLFLHNISDVYSATLQP